MAPRQGGCSAPLRRLRYLTATAAKPATLHPGRHAQAFKCGQTCFVCGADVDAIKYNARTNSYCELQGI